jgi:hypothetical protein
MCKPPLLKTLAAGELAIQRLSGHLLLLCVGAADTVRSSSCESSTFLVTSSRQSGRDQSFHLWNRSSEVALRAEAKRYNLRRFIAHQTYGLSRLLWLESVADICFAGCYMTPATEAEPQVQDVHTHLQAVQCKWLVL